MKAQQLRNSIYKIIISGKLFVQDSDDEDWETFINKLRIAKDDLIKNPLLIKREKYGTDIFKELNKNIDEKNSSTNDDMPFKIPSSWKWIKLKNLCLSITNGITPKIFVSKGIPTLSIKNISKGKFDLTDIKYISNDVFESLLNNKKPKIDDILYGNAGTLGAAIKSTLNFNYSAINTVGLIKLKDKSQADYIVMVFNSSYGLKWINSVKVGGGMKHLNLSDVGNFLIPLPPLKELKKINSKLNDLNLLINKYEEKKSELTNLYKSFTDKFKKSVAKAIIEGVLGKQKNKKDCSSICKDDNSCFENVDEKTSSIYDVVPFKIPSSWKWIKLKDLCLLITLGIKNKTFVSKGIPFLTIRNISKGKFDLTDIRYIPNDVFESSSNNKKPKMGDILFGNAGTLGAAITSTLNFDYSILSTIGLIKLKDKSLADYIVMVFNSSYGLKWINSVKVGGGLKHLNLGDVGNFLIPLPSKHELPKILNLQKKLFGLIDEFDNLYESFTSLD